MSGAEPEERVGLPILRQAWCDILFLHWRYPPDVVAELLPEGLVPDLVDGAAWVSLTPFLARSTRPPVLPALPLVSAFPETNVRTYVRGGHDLDGLWFLTLEVGSTPTAIGGRLGAGVPYRRATMRIDHGADVTTYSSRRADDAAVGHTIRARRGDVLASPTELDHWLTGRWRAWTRLGSRLMTIPVHHEPWPLHDAEVLTLEETLLAACGLPPPVNPPLVHASPGVEARIGMPRLGS